MSARPGPHHLACRYPPPPLLPPLPSTPGPAALPPPFPFLSLPSGRSSPLRASAYTNTTTTTTSQAGHYSLYTALREAFGWVRGNVPLALDGEADVAAAWPDVSEAALRQLLLEGPLSEQQVEAGGQLANAAGLVEACCFPRARFAQLAAAAVTGLRALQADLPLLAELGDNMDLVHWSSAFTRPAAGVHVMAAQGEGGGSGRHSSAGGGGDHRRRSQQRRALLDGWLAEMRAKQAEVDVEARAVTQLAEREAREGRHGAARALLGTIPSNFNYSMPPGFTVQPPGGVPTLFVPIVFHVMLYADTGGATGPPSYTSAQSFLERLVRVTNFQAKPSGFQFWIQQARADPAAYPYLRLNSRNDWLYCPMGGTGTTKNQCLYNSTFMRT